MLDLQSVPCHSWYVRRGYSGLGLKCPNAPHLWQLGWGLPLADFNITEDLPLGVTRTYTLPVAVTERRSFLRIRTASGIYYINHRRAQGVTEEVRLEAWNSTICRHYTHNEWLCSVHTLHR